VWRSIIGQAGAVSAPRRALILAPMTLELRPVVKRLGARPAQVDGIKVFRAQRAGVDITVAQIGVGPTMAAQVTTRLLDLIPVDHVVVSGIAGGLDPGATIGTVILPAVVLDVSSGREYHPSPLGDVPLSGKIGTVDELIGDPTRLASLAEQGVLALEMEAAGVAAACEPAGIPWSVVRVISDRPDDGLTEAPVLDALRPDGTTDAWAALRLVAARPSRIPGFVRLGRDSSMAAGKAAAATLAALS
jgi:adenosylhomocysteine nucleosidase